MAAKKLGMEISIHPPRAGRDPPTVIMGSVLGISIHPPRAGRDAHGVVGRILKRISIHPPRAGRDSAALVLYRVDTAFQSTRPVRGGTLKRGIDLAYGKFQSTRPVRGGTKRIYGANRGYLISIHPPRAGRDNKSKMLFFP